MLQKLQLLRKKLCKKMGGVYANYFSLSHVIHVTKWNFNNRPASKIMLLKYHFLCPIHTVKFSLPIHGHLGKIWYYYHGFTATQKWWVCDMQSSPYLSPSNLVSWEALVLTT